MEIHLIVLLQFKPETSPTVQHDVAAGFKALKENCIHPGTQKPYILSMKGVSIEGAQNGISHAFVSSFASFEDRDYFVKSDPAHIELVQNAKGYLDKVLVIDFTNGVLIKKL
ncbi:hypothetical protein ASPWEDRAFT_117796 [Aspergillus wentii DTO 134E9]|uniref:Stress-response A/B barrel domain-containing protein n=1 Tax=Aspergillus wentii DTO 134E9 TaxID=1073089 RepID=A0A1L9RB74_ASPWE|nr:uncharacterized protein ASPWEDRAFT_117796 [Aspergillus wentii DTO 134E9]OJJ32182.1 hypothetical protein ASPWEDRAFT_117796 [Aspergillus wentii DTO 134E9]